jgi:hypothetical protein
MLQLMIPLSPKGEGTPCQKGKQVPQLNPPVEFILRLRPVDSSPFLFFSVPLCRSLP